ncbi:hypothetical protein NLI96_g36 [Meripilus lineatus]|uniref:Uncharacterized protein n=1 Tax=Meripilus lineatus TaxID=2056292 RepID=A0AAD5YMF2_9APHY|nr:hypothetical protein NLI96_g36 [Physisporinus lineatus]
MSLRRIAQTNAAIQSSPRANDASSQTTPTTPVKTSLNGLPTTPRTRLVYPMSPVTSPSLSASRPFDWDAARARKPPPYASPLANKQRGRARQSDTPGKPGPSKRVVRNRGIVEK